MSDVDTNHRLRALHRAYAEQLPHRIRQIDLAWETVRQKDWDPVVLGSLRLKIRSLAGSGATFGFAALADTARNLELYLESVVIGRSVPTDEQVSRISHYLEALRQACFESPLAEVRRQTLEVSSVLDLEHEREKIRRVIFLLSEDSRLAADYGFELGCFGLLLRRFSELSEMLSFIEHTPPAAILVDAEKFEERLAETQKVAEFQRERDMPIPLLVLASRSDLHSRLEAVRAGAEAYLVKPFESRSLLEKVDLIAQRSGSDPYRILIAEKNYSQGLDYSLTFQRAGMATHLVTEPLRVLEALIDFEPDLVLMNVSLLGVGGVELAAVIRQEDAYMTVPIVLLSEERLLQRQLEAMRSGADDFLTVPIPGEHLVSAVIHHVQRARALRGFIARDSLTGLLNHTKLIERLQVEVARARREQSSLSYALLDIDHLNSLNETFGHLSGDSVLRSLARLMEQRMRRSDVIGRYGGDELAVIMPETTGVSAVKVLDEIRARFAEIRHYSADAEFFATFSCGVAALSESDDTQSTHQTARHALQSARLRGRNCVVLAGR